jgi:hypothetical protein
MFNIQFGFVVQVGIVEVGVVIQVETVRIGIVLNLPRRVGHHHLLDNLLDVMGSDTTVCTLAMIDLTETVLNSLVSLAACWQGVDDGRIC